MRQENLKLIREKCIAANPDIENGCRCNACIAHECCADKRYISLADVLAASRSLEGSLAVDKDGLFIIPTMPKLGGWQAAIQYCPVWNIYKDNLEDQSDDCINFLAYLLS